MLTIIINVIGALLILFIVWWFWLVKTGRQQRAKKGELIKVIVEGGVYTPDSIEAKRDQEINLQFLRKDSSPCAEAVIFADLDMSIDLPIDQPKQIKLKIDKPGVFEFTCPMGMYRGKLLIQ